MTLMMMQNMMVVMTALWLMHRSSCVERMNTLSCTTPLSNEVKDQCAGILSPTYCGQTLRRGCPSGCYICGSLCFFQRDHPDNGHLCKECYEENWSTCEDSSAFSSAEQPVRNTLRVCACLSSVNVPQADSGC